MAEAIQESLSDFEEAQGVGFEAKNFVDNIQDDKDREHSRIRKNIVTISLIILVIVMNSVVVCMIWHVVDVELSLISEKSLNPENRIVTDKVILALIGGTVAQVSALFLIAVKSIFNDKGAS
ncbi:TPA: hypothetical protein NGU80_004754 [Vibrio parahaemolyticus]|uniref:hypothetical protein n=1 Tax=Vibrio harveyi group TaxID=717610 RepID=UPI00111E90B6|nr:MULTISPECIES: hypothetical protein [Vibrio harveyi group]MBS9880938.1 hypothetical protein [Vibrio alginolyticus]TOL63174.1 hypothetical protein CGH93_23135 [Vibrio parahaemolyticus]HCE4735548.1 hypothetical protein [Vibrio parahaemolyticus]HCG9872202.1 hypothetical protein [Vibrio parahaemolyticus]